MLYYPFAPQLFQNMFHSCSFQGIPMDPQLPLCRCAGRRHHFSSCSSLADGFGVRDCSSAICLSERYHIGGGRCGSYRSQSLQNLSCNRSNPLFSDYQDLGRRGACGRSCGSFDVGNYGGANQHCRTHLNGYRECFSDDSYHRSGLGGDSGSSGRMHHGERKNGSAGRGSPSGGLDLVGDRRGGKNRDHSGESNGGGGGGRDWKTFHRRDLSEKGQNNYVDFGAHGRRSGGGRLGGHLGRRGSMCDFGQDRTQGVHTGEGLHKPVKVDTDPEIQRVWMEEGEQIRKLNRQCASCINKVHVLQQQNTVLLTQWELLQQQCLERGSLQNTKSLLQSHMQDMQMLLNTMQGQKEQLLLELQQLKAVTEEYEQRHKEELNKHMASEDELATLKKDIDSAYAENTDLDVKTDLLIGQIVRLRSIYEMELIELQRRVHDGTNGIVFTDNHRDLNIDNFLEEVRCQYEEIVQRSKEEVDARYRGKYEELHIMCGMHYESLCNSHQEIQELTHHIRMLKMELEKLKKKNTKLKETIADSKQRGDRALNDAKENLHDLEHDLHKARDKLTQLLQDFQEQLHAKLALDTESTICRKQLERGDYRLHQVIAEHASASVGYGAERARGSIRNSRHSRVLCGNGRGNRASGMHYGSACPGYSYQRGSNIFGVTTCSGSRTYSSGGEGYDSKGTNSSTSREYDHKSMGASASEVSSLAACGNGDSPGSGGYGSRDISSVEEDVKSKTDSRNGDCVPGSLGGGLGDSEGRRNSGSGEHDSRNICSFGEGVHNPSTCETGGYNFGISTGRSRCGSGGNVVLGNDGHGAREEAESGTNEHGSRDRPVSECGKVESIQPPEYKNAGYSYESSRCPDTPGNREFGSREINNSVGFICSPVVSDRARYTSESWISPGRSTYGSGVEAGLGRGGYGSRDGPTCENDRNDSVVPPNYGRCNEGDRTPGNRELGSQGISGGAVSTPWSCETGGNGSGSGMYSSKVSELSGASGGRGYSGSEEYGFRSMSNPGGGESSLEIRGTRRHNFGTGVNFRI